MACLGRAALLLVVLCAPFPIASAQPQNASPPSSPVRLVFVHHSTGQNWLADGDGRLGIALRDNSYFVSDTNYGWGPGRPTGGAIGDTTDIGHWYDWFSGPQRDTYVAALYAESAQHSSYSRLATDPGGAKFVPQLARFVGRKNESGLTLWVATDPESDPVSAEWLGMLLPGSGPSDFIRSLQDFPARARHDRSALAFKIHDDGSGNTPEVMRLAALVEPQEGVV